MNRFALVIAVSIPWHLAAGAEHQITTHDGDTIVLRFETPTNVIERAPGRRHSWGHAGCLMCLHNHLVGTHRQGSDYLRLNGWASWTTIHDNLHNDPSFEGQGGTRRYVGRDVGAPKEPSAFAPTPLDVCEEMLDLAGVGRDDVVCDLGCGDGRLLVIAALKYNCTAVGLDIDPACVEKANENFRRYGVDHLARAYERDARTTDIGGASVVTLYLMPNLTEELRSRLQGLPAGTRVVAHDKPIPRWSPDDQIWVDSSFDSRRHGVYLWRTVAQKEPRAKPKSKT